MDLHQYRVCAEELWEVTGSGDLLEIPEGTVRIRAPEIEHSEHVTCVVIPASVRELSADAFSACTEQTDFVVSEYNRVYYAWNGMVFRREDRALAAVPRGRWYLRIPEGTCTILANACSSAPLLESLELPESLLRIEQEAFSDCICLKQVHLPDRLQLLGAGAFSRCRLLERVSLPETLTAMEHGRFGTPFAGCGRLTDLTFRGDNAMYTVRDGMIFAEQGRILVSAPAAAGCFRIPDGVRELGPCVFADCMELQEVVIPASVKKVGEYAFARSSIRSVSFPDGLEALPRSVCEYCPMLEKVSIPPTVTTICTQAFCGCDRLQELRLPHSVKKLGHMALGACSGLRRLYVDGDDLKLEWPSIPLYSMELAILAPSMSLLAFPKELHFPFLRGYCLSHPLGQPVSPDLLACFQQLTEREHLHICRLGLKEPMVLAFLLHEELVTREGVRYLLRYCSDAEAAAVRAYGRRMKRKEKKE